jgi:hypothetical protein
MQTINVARPIALGAFLHLLTPFQFFLMVPGAYDGSFTPVTIEESLEHVDDEVLERQMVARWSEDGKTVILAKHRTCGETQEENDKAALIIKHRSVVFL